MSGNENHHIASEGQTPGYVEGASTHHFISEESQKRRELERKVGQSFYETGKALEEMRQKRLFSLSHTSFEQFCFDQFKIKRAHIYRLIEAAKVVDNLKLGAPPASQILPKNEFQARPLVNLSPAQQRAAWEMAIQKSHGRCPPSRVVKEVVLKLYPDSSAEPSLIFSERDVVQVQSRGDRDLLPINGCWAIVEKVDPQAQCCVVRVASIADSITVQSKNLTNTHWPTEKRDEAYDLVRRTGRLASVRTLEPIAHKMLQTIAKRQNPTLTPLEEQILQLIEKTYAHDRRESKRIEIDLPIECLLYDGTNEILRGRIHNISPDGIFFNCGRSLKANSPIRLNLLPGEPEGPIQCEALVVHSSQGGIGCKLTVVNNQAGLARLYDEAHYAKRMEHPK